MRKLLAAVIATFVGFVVAVFIGILVAPRTMFYGNGDSSAVSSAVFFVAPLGGAAAGVVGAASGKTPYVVAVLTGSLFALLGIFGSPFSEEPIWMGTVGGSIAAVVAGFLGMKIGRTGEMRKLLAAVIAAPVGLVVAGLIGFIVGMNPIFYCEDIAIGVFFIAAGGGAVAGLVGAIEGKTTYIVAVLTGAVFAVLTIRDGSPFIVISLGTVGVSIAAAVAGFLGMKIGRFTANWGRNA